MCMIVIMTIVDIMISSNSSSSSGSSSSSSSSSCCSIQVRGKMLYTRNHRSDNMLEQPLKIHWQFQCTFIGEVTTFGKYH